MSPLRRAIRKLTASGRPAQTAPPATRPFFVCGHPRSGTNWLSAILNLHPRIYCDGEFHFHHVRQGVEAFQSQPWYVANREPLRSASNEAMYDFVHRCLDAQAHRPAEQGGKPQATEVGDHTPRALRWIIPPPRGRYIVISRDGRDVIVSWTFHLINTARVGLVHPALHDLYKSVIPGAADSPEATREAAMKLLSERPWVRCYAWQWADHIRHDLWMIDEREKAAASAGEPCGVLRASYEELHADTEAQRARIYRFLGVDPAEAAPLSREGRTAPGFEKESPRAFCRRGQVGDWRNYLSDKAHGWVLEVAAERLQALGYDAPAPLTVHVPTPQPVLQDKQA